MSKRLTAADWVAFALKILTQDGFEALNADGLARRLGVSRGSFYWHFPHLAVFHAAVIAEWRRVATEAIIVDIEQHQTQAERLDALLRRAFGNSTRIEGRMRAWAQSNALATRAVGEIDRRRLDYIGALLVATGVPEPQALIRAQILYWAYLGAAGNRRKHFTDERLEALVAELMGLALARPR